MTPAHRASVDRSVCRSVPGPPAVSGLHAVLASLAIGSTLAMLLVLGGTARSVAAQEPALPTLHHAHLNSTDPEAAIEWYRTVWPDGKGGEIAGHPAFLAEMPLLFNRVSEPPTGAFDPELGRSVPQSPFWHIGGFVNTTGVFERLEAAGIEVLRLHVGPVTGSAPPRIVRSGLTPYAGIRTTSQLAEQAGTGTRAADPPRDGGFGYLLGPDGALVELTGGPSTDASFSHVHLFHEHPRCAANWYVEYLGMAFPPVRDPETGATRPGRPAPECAAEAPGEPGWPSLEAVGTIRRPSASVRFGGGGISFYPRQCQPGRCGADGVPLVSSRGQVLDHVAFSVPDLDGRLARLRGAGIRVLEGPYPFGGGRAALIEGPDGLAIELVEAAP